MNAFKPKELEQFYTNYFLRLIANVIAFNRKNYCVLTQTLLRLIAKIIAFNHKDYCV